MEIEYLREFRELVRYGEFTLASEKLYISQPTLTRHIKALEDEFGLPLIVRPSQRVELTKFGKILLVYANDVIERTDDLLDTFHEVNNVNKNVIRVFFTAPPNQIIEGFVEKFPKYTVELIKNDPPKTPIEQIDMLARDECDFLLSTLDEKRSAVFSSQFLRNDRLCALLYKDHQLAHREEIELEALRDETFIMWTRGSFDSDFAETCCESAGFQPNISIRTGDGSYIASLISRKKGISLAIVPESTPFHPEEGIRTIPIANVKPVQRRVYYRKGLLPERCNLFIRHIQLNAHQTMPET